MFQLRLKFLKFLNRAYLFNIEVLTVCHFFQFIDFCKIISFGKCTGLDQFYQILSPRVFLDYFGTIPNESVLPRDFFLMVDNVLLVILVRTHPQHSLVCTTSSHSPSSSPTDDLLTGRLDKESSLAILWEHAPMIIILILVKLSIKNPKNNAKTTGLELCRWENCYYQKYTT